MRVCPLLLLIGIAVVSLTVLGGCDGSGDGDKTEATATAVATEAEYLEGVRAIEKKLGDVFDKIDAALDITWPTRGRLFGVLQEADISRTLATQLEASEQLSPPNHFRSDHERYRQFLHDVTPFVRDHDRAVEAADLVGVFVNRAEGFAIRERFENEMSPTFCKAIAPPDAPSDDVAADCDGSESLPGGEYGAKVHAIMKQYRAEFGPRVSSFPPMMTPKELFAALLALNREIETVIGEALQALEELEPPAEFRTDHARLLQYFEENLNLARAITRAAEEQDDEKLRSEYFPESGVVLCGAKQDLSPAIRPIVDTFFSFDEPEPCTEPA